MPDRDTLDPEDWQSVRRTFHDAIDLAIDYLRDIREKPVWSATPEAVKARLIQSLPRGPAPLDDVLETFASDILPYGTGNTHPRFFGWVHGSGNLAGALGEALAGFMNCNVGGRDHVAVYVERQVIAWCKEILSFPQESSGLLTTGTSMGTVIALAVARDQMAKGDVQHAGVAASPQPLVGYASAEAHSCIAKAFDLLGLGHDALRRVPVDGNFRLSLDELAAMVAVDRARGAAPILVVASAGTVNTGAIDDIAAIATFCRAQGLWLHVDAAFGGLAGLTHEFRPALAAIAEAQSVAFDFHKWLQVPYDAGCVLVRDEAAHRAAFAHRREYLAGAVGGLAGGDPWYCDYGPELSRGFRALKVWFTIKTYGMDALADVVARNCRQAAMLGRAVSGCNELELMVPVSLNIACFRYVARDLDDGDLDALNTEIVTALQMQGIAAPSTTRIRGRVAIRVCLVNHRTTSEDLDILVNAVCRLGGERVALRRAARPA